MNADQNRQTQTTERDALMAEVDFLLDCAKKQPDVGVACSIALAAQVRLNAIKALDRMNEAFRSYEESRHGR